MVDDAIPAATLILVRDRVEGPPELLLVERAAGMAFAAGALVFPGGRIDEADRELAAEISGADGAMIAAIRETIEETAVPVGVNPLPTQAVGSKMQDALVDDQPFAQVLRNAGCELDPGQLTPFARWVPKFHAVRRFDTLFYVAEAPAGDWPARVVEGECSGAFWMTASDALAREARDEARLIFPTRRNLERLAQHGSFAEIVADARCHAIDPITPWVEERDGQKFVTIPNNLGYPVTQEPLDGLWRG